MLVLTVVLSSNDGSSPFLQLICMSLQLGIIDQVILEHFAPICRIIPWAGQSRANEKNGLSVLQS